MRLKTTALLFTLLASLPVYAGNLNMSQHQRVEVAFVLDTTGSMGDLIDGAKRKIWSIATTVVETNPNAEVAMALVAYRDRGDAYVVKTTPLSEDIQGMYGKLVQLQADGGDDTPESVNEALNKAISGLQWSTGDNIKRIVFLVGDAPPHMDYKQEKQYPAILKNAVSKGIVVNAVQAGDMAETTPVWKEIAQFGHGRYISIPQDGGEVVVIITPYDGDILNMQRELDGSVVPYGNLQQKSELDAKIKQRAAAPSAVQLDNSKYYSKRVSKEVVTGGGDLLADVENKNISLDKVADAELPAELAAKPKADRLAWIEEKLTNRKNLEAKMTDLIAKRDAFVLEQKSQSTKKTAPDSFDQAVEETLRAQLN